MEHTRHPSHARTSTVRARVAPTATSSEVASLFPAVLGLLLLIILLL